MRCGVLRHRPFALLFAGQAISSLGDRLVNVALAFAVLELTGSVTDLGLVIAAQTAPLLLFVLLGGVWADRLPRQRLMLASDVVRAGAQGLSAALLLTGNAHVWELAALQAIYGAAAASFGPASTAVVPQTVDPDSLQQANALIGLSAELTSVLGPALAGVIVVAANPGWGLAVDAATVAARLVLGPQIARTSLGGAGAWAAITAATGLGSLAGALIALRWRPRYPLRAAFLIFLVGGPALYWLVAAHAPLGVILVVAVIDGTSGTIFNTLWYTAIQRDVPPVELSRVTSWDYLGTLAMQPIGLALTGPVAAVLGVSATLAGAGGLFLGLLLAVLAVPAVRNFTGAPAPEPTT